MFYFYFGVCLEWATICFIRCTETMTCHIHWIKKKIYTLCLFHYHKFSLLPLWCFIVLPYNSSFKFQCCKYVYYIVYFLYTDKKMEQDGMCCARTLDAPLKCILCNVYSNLLRKKNCFLFERERKEIGKHKRTHCCFRQISTRFGVNKAERILKQFVCYCWLLKINK